jgi:hypothetical protein
VLILVFDFSSDILSDYCALRGYIYQRLDGTVPSETRRKAIEHYNAPDSPDFVFLLSTRAGGLGINLETGELARSYQEESGCSRILPLSRHRRYLRQRLVRSLDLGETRAPI